MKALPMLCLTLSIAGAAGAVTLDDVPYGVASTRWPAHLGNHRARVQVEAKAEDVVLSACDLHGGGFQ